MAPGRRRGSGKAAAAAASRKQWKIGDLVLAKMKGFPAWPAMISDPEKWGYSSDRKKLLVFFYGTKQIAFCNYADIEAFTEEKKKSLLSKRHGKGSDFVRAVDEIIDIYDKLKKDNSEGNFGDECILPNHGNLEGSGSMGNKKNPELSSCMTGDKQLEAFDTSVASTDVSNTEDVPAALGEGVLCKMNEEAKEPVEKISILDQLRQTPLAVTTVKKRLRDVSLQSCTFQRRMPSLRRSRSSSSVDPCKVQNSAAQTTVGVESGKVVIVDVVSEESMNRKTVIAEVQKPSTPKDVNSLGSEGLILNIGCKNIDSDIVKTDSEAISSEEEHTLPSTCVFKHCTNGHLNSDAELNPRSGASLNVVTLTKKRSLNRRRVNKASDCGLPSNNFDFQIEEKGTVVESLKSCNAINERFHKTDGDGHLPLVKRARVRMGESIADEKFLHTEKAELEILVSKSDQNTISGSPCNCSPANLVGKEASGCSSMLNNGISYNPSEMKFWKDKYQLKNISVDVEAALPPSKRLYRALEAMSANADDFKVDQGNAPGSTDLIANGCMNSPRPSSFHLSTGDVESYDMHSYVNVASFNVTSDLPPDSTTKDLDVSASIPSGANVDGSHNGNLHESDYNMREQIPADINHGDGFSACKTINADVHEKTLQPAPLSGEGQVNATSIEVMSAQLSHSVTADAKNVMLNPTAVCPDSVVDESTEKDVTLDAVSANLDSETVSHHVLPNRADAALSVVDGGSTSSAISGASKSPNSQSYDTAGGPDMQDAATEITQKLTLKDRGFSPGLAPIKLLIAAAQAKRPLSRSTSFSDKSTDSKTLAHHAVDYREDSSDQGSSAVPLAVHGPASDDSAQVQPNISRLQSVALQQGLSRQTGPDEADLAWKTFEASLYMVSRTKESIGRATRLALECAKYGMAGEVIELLLKNLERETCLYRRVDLFFLVDSIIQCSRSQKGGTGDVYFSLVQSVLSRLLCAAAPPGKAAYENRRQCLKVLRLWLERKILPESIVRHHIRDLDFGNEGPFCNHSSRRPSRNERAYNDPVREMEGMLVDEYGSNTSFQLSSLMVAHDIEGVEQECSSEEKEFEAVTPEKNSEDDCSGTITEKHRHILEDVDGELEMEDVSPTCVVRGCGSPSSHVPGADIVCRSENQCHRQPSPPFVPPLPEDKPPSPPPLPSSPPPVESHSSPPSFLHNNPPVALFHCLGSAVDSNAYGSTQNGQNQVSHSACQQPGSLPGNSVPSASMPYYSFGYGDGRHMSQSASSVHCSSSYGSFLAAHPTTPCANKALPLVSPLFPNKSYLVQPPPPTVSNQFSYFQAEPQQRSQAWGNCSSSFNKSFQFVHDLQQGKFYNDTDTSVPIQHDVIERCRCSPTVNSGSGPSVNVEASSAPISYYGPPLEPSPISCHRWPHPPRISGYHSVSAPRPPLENPISRVDKVHSFWRPR